MLAAASLPAQDAAERLAKAGAAFQENRPRERYWNWTTVTERSIIDKSGKVLETFPSVTVESPIRSDGKRCNAVLAWGDGVPPYLGDAPADERCKVEQESGGLFQLQALFASRRVRMLSGSAEEVVLAVDPDKTLAQSPDLPARCMAAMRATVRLDPATSFPRHVSLEAMSDGCLMKQQTATDHYDADAQLQHVNKGISKGSLLEFDYELQIDRAGDHTKDFWICVRQQTIRPWQKGTAAMLVYGRRLQPRGTESDRRLVVKGNTTAAELATDSLIKFDTGKDR
jgi:hypothetical protein